jgi:hypothetical protein
MDCIVNQKSGSLYEVVSGSLNFHAPMRSNEVTKDAKRTVANKVD